jgi:tetratricopeptide (TPR) repeat protein
VNEHDLDRDWEARLVLDERPGPAMRQTPGQADQLIAAALRAFDGGDVLAKRSPRPWGTIAIAAGLAVALVATGATAAIWIYHSSAPPPPAPKPAPTPQSEAAPDVEPEAEEEAEPEAPLEPSIAPLPHRHHPSATDADLLRAANALRKDRRWPEAERRYREVITRFPKSQSAYVAEVAAGSLRLEQLDDPTGALRLFKRAILRTPKGSLDEEARLGIADAEHALGHPKSEIEALEKLIEAHPRSPLVERAKKRLAQLGVEKP